MAVNEKNMTSGSPGKLIITFAIPLMLGNVFQQFYTMADTMIVGQVVGVEALAAVFAARLKPTAAHPTSRPFTAWGINGREARQNEVSKPLVKAAVWPGGNGACPLHVRDHHSSFSCDKTDCGAADRRDAAAVRPCGDFCTDAGVWKAAVAVYR